jgi:hypothetical protein
VARSPRTYALHELGEGAIYGLHAIPETGGVYVLDLKPRAGAGPKVSFDIGVGVAMATEAGEGKKGASRRPAAGAGGGRMVVSSVGPKTEMRAIGESWTVLEQLAAAGSLGLANAQAEAKIIAGLLVKSKDKPPKAANPPGEYHGMLDKLAADFNAIAAQQDAKKLQQAVTATETECLKCHVQYRWELTADVSRWPKFDVAEGKAP